MRLAVMGAGGLGGLFGALLAAAGEAVAFVARGAHLAAIRDHGLKVESGRGDLLIRPARATDDPREIGPVDAVLFTVKLWDTEAAAELCRPLLAPATAVLTLQNGVDAEARIAGVLGARHVLGGVAYVPSAIRAPGVIRHTGRDTSLTFGELDGRRTRRARRLRAAFRRAGIEATLTGDIRRARWEKLVFLVASSGVTSLTGMSYGPLRADPAARAMFRAAMEEAAAVARARGIAIGDGFIAGRMAFLDRAPAEMTSSMARDLARGSRLELDWIQGAVVRMGRESGIDTPVNAAIYEALDARRASFSLT